MNLVIHQVIFCKDSDSFCFCKMDAKKEGALASTPQTLIIITTIILLQLQMQ